MTIHTETSLLVSSRPILVDAFSLWQAGQRLEREYAHRTGHPTDFRKNLHDMVLALARDLDATGSDIVAALDAAKAVTGHSQPSEDPELLAGHIIACLQVYAEKCNFDIKASLEEAAALLADDEPSPTVH